MPSGPDHLLLPPGVPAAAIPEVRNHTRYSSQYFQMMDVDDALFHAMVCCITYELRPATSEQAAQAGNVRTDQELLIAHDAAVPAPLCEADEFLPPYDPAAEGDAAVRHAPAAALAYVDPAALSLRSVRQESDFAPYKPRCDLLIVNARAWSPDIQASAALAGQRGEALRKPLARWPAGAQLQHADGRMLWRKVLEVTGPRSLSPGALGWRLAEPEPATSVPIRYELAFGGTNQWWPGWPSQPWAPATDPGGASGPPLDLHGLANPVGTGWAAAPWRQQVLGRAKRLRAPQIEAMGQPFAAHHADRASDHAERDPAGADAAYPAIGLGPIGRWWLPRRALAGTYDAAWREHRWPRLPRDFDFGYWNCAPADQQIDYPAGGELLSLANLTPAGQSALRLPAPDLHLRVRLRAGPVFVLPMHIDTVLLDLGAMTLTLVHRRCVPASPGAEVRVLELGSGTGGDRIAELPESLGPAARR